VASSVSQTIRNRNRIAIAIALATQPFLVGQAVSDADSRWEQQYRQTCAECHDKGKAKRPDARGAPRLGDARAWESRIAKGREAMYRKLLTGPHGRENPQPKKQEWRGDLIDNEIGNVLDYMLEQLP
jgi:cytochrome c5